MVVTFRNDIPIEDTMSFDLVYEENLQMEVADKADVIAKGIVCWMLVDGELAGEIYGVSPAVLDEDIEDCTDKDPALMYCYSTTILPKFQGKGLGKILVSYWDGLVKGAGYRAVVGHATSPTIKFIREFFGAKFSAVHEKWYDTDRVAHFYELEL